MMLRTGVNSEKISGMFYTGGQDWMIEVVPLAVWSINQRTTELFNKIVFFTQIYKYAV